MKIDFAKLLNHPCDKNGLVSYLHFPVSIATEVFEALTGRDIYWASGAELVSGWHEIYGDMASDYECVELSFWKAGDEFEVCYRLYKEQDKSASEDSYSIDDVILDDTPVEVFDLTKILGL